MKVKKEIDHTQLIENLFKNFGLAESEIKQIISVYKLDKLKKGDQYLKEGKVSNKIGILMSGILFAYTINDFGEKNVSRFFYSPQNLIVVNFESFLSNEKSEETIECFEDSFLITILKTDLEKLYNDIPRLNSIGRSLAEDSYINALRKIKLLQSKNAKDRIKTLRDQSPELFQKLPANYIASYLGMHRNTYQKALN